MPKTIALYAGSFDPFTKGHLDVVGKATKTFDKVYVSFGVNPNKKRLFGLPEAMALAGQSLMDHYLPGQTGGWTNHNDVLSHPGIPVVLSEYTGSTMKYAKSIGATHVVRGLRQAGDFNDEFGLAGTAGHIDRDIIFTHFICREDFLHISSSTARELASLGEDIDWLVTPSVRDALYEKFNIK